MKISFPSDFSWFGNSSVFSVYRLSSLSNSYLLHCFGYDLLYMKSISCHACLWKICSTNPIHGISKVESYLLYGKPSDKRNRGESLGHDLILGSSYNCCKRSFSSFVLLVRDNGIELSFWESNFIDTHSWSEVLRIYESVRIKFLFPISKLRKNFFVLFFECLGMKMVPFRYGTNRYCVIVYVPLLKNRRIRSPSWYRETPRWYSYEGVHPLKRTSRICVLIWVLIFVLSEGNHR